MYFENIGHTSKLWAPFRKLFASPGAPN